MDPNQLSSSQNVSTGGYSGPSVNLSASCGGSTLSAALQQQQQQQQQNEPELFRVKGHVFLRRTYHKPTYCHYCGDLLWGLMNQGFTCIICNMVSHERCMRGHCLTPCLTLLHASIKMPASHAFLEAKTSKRKLFCSACRRRIDDRMLLQCELCETYIHCECLRSALNNCRVFYSSFAADRAASDRVIPASVTHVFREGNLPSSSKCAACNKNCASTDCFSGLRCELCQLTVHSYCKSLVVQDCDFGPLSSSLLNPAAVLMPPPVVIDYKSQLAPRRGSSSFIVAPEEDSGPNSEPPSRHDGDDSPLSSPTRADIKPRFSEEQEVFIYDGRDALRRGTRRTLFVTPNTSVLSALDGALRAFTLADDPSKYEFQIINFDMSMGDTIDPTIPLFCQLPLAGAAKALGVTSGGALAAFPDAGSSGFSSSGAGGSLAPESSTKSNNSPNTSVAFPEAIHLLLKRRSSDAGFVTFYADWIKSDAGTRSVFCTSKMTVADAIQVVLKKFDLPNAVPSDYVLRLVSLEASKDRDEVVLPNKEILWSYLENQHSASLSSAFLSRVYIGQTSELMGDMPVSVFVGNLPSGRSQREYESALQRKLGQANRWLSIEMIYYEHGAIVLSFPNATIAMNAIRLLRDSPVPTSYALTATTSSGGAAATTATTSQTTPSTTTTAMPPGAVVLSGQQNTVGLAQAAAQTAVNVAVTSSLVGASADSQQSGVALLAQQQAQNATMMMQQMTMGSSAGGGTAASASAESGDKSEKRLFAMCLPKIKPLPAFSDNVPVLVLVNTRSGGCQGVDLLRSFRQLLNPCQVFSLEHGGPLPALHAFRELPQYRILCCGGDGTVGWVLSCLDNVSQDSTCQSPPVAVMPLGTGNDLARVLNWGHGYTGSDQLFDWLADVMTADAVNFDRWTISITPSDSTASMSMASMPANVMTKQSAEDNSSVMLMNNYFGIGIDAEVALAFHKEREEQPHKFTSRINNQAIYVKNGLKKLIGRNDSSNLHRLVRIEVDGRTLELPPLEGIVILNIASWGGGCDIWGSERSSSFTKAAFDDGLLEVMGIGSVLHLGQMASNIRTGFRLAQGEHIHVHLLQDMAVHVDGEPWCQPAGHINVRRSALRAVMLKRVKRKMQRRNTEPPSSSQAAGSRAGTTAATSAVGQLVSQSIASSAEESSGEAKQ